MISLLVMISHSSHHSTGDSLQAEVTLVEQVGGTLSIISRTDKDNLLSASRIRQNNQAKARDPVHSRDNAMQAWPDLLTTTTTTTPSHLTEYSVSSPSCFIRRPPCIRGQFCQVCPSFGLFGGRLLGSSSRWIFGLSLTFRFLVSLRERIDPLEEPLILWCSYLF